MLADGCSNVAGFRERDQIGGAGFVSGDACTRRVVTTAVVISRTGVARLRDAAQQGRRPRLAPTQRCPPDSAAAEHSRRSTAITDTRAVEATTAARAEPAPLLRSI